MADCGGTLNEGPRSRARVTSAPPQACSAFSPHLGPPLSLQFLQVWKRAGTQLGQRTTGWGQDQRTPGKLLGDQWLAPPLALLPGFPMVIGMFG